MSTLQSNLDVHWCVILEQFVSPIVYYFTVSSSRLLSPEYECLKIVTNMSVNLFVPLRQPHHLYIELSFEMTPPPSI